MENGRQFKKTVYYRGYRGLYHGLYRITGAVRTRGAGDEEKRDGGGARVKYFTREYVWWMKRRRWRGAGNLITNGARRLNEMKRIW